MLKSLFLTIVLCIATITVNAQSELSGRWSATCLAEQIAPGNFKICNICKFQNDGDDIKVTPFYIAFANNRISFVVSHDTISDGYTYDPVQRTLSFTFEGIPYQFKIMSGLEKGKMVWKTEEGFLIYLNEIKSIALPARKK